MADPNLNGVILPLDVLVRVLCFLNVYDELFARAVCRWWRALIAQDRVLKREIGHTTWAEFGRDRDSGRHPPISKTYLGAFTPKLYAAMGNGTLAQARFFRPTLDMLITACWCGRLAMVMSLCERAPALLRGGTHEWRVRNCAYGAAEQGHFHILNYLYAKRAITMPHQIAHSEAYRRGGGGNLSTVKWFVARFPRNPKVLEATVSGAIQGGNTRVLDWALDERKFSFDITRFGPTFEFYTAQRAIDWARARGILPPLAGAPQE
jgi:hypothetical protein